MSIWADDKILDGLEHMIRECARMAPEFPVSVSIRVVAGGGIAVTLHGPDDMIVTPTLRESLSTLLEGQGV